MNTIPAAKRDHYKGDYQRRAKACTTAAYANPNTKCWRCGRTIAEHPPHKNGTPPRWDAGHLKDGDPRSPIRAEVSTCNRREGAIAGNAKRSSGYNW